MPERSKIDDALLKKFSTRLLTVPNVLTCLRIILIVPFLIFFLHKDYTAAFIILAVSGVTDFLDGFTARLLNQVSDLGKCLDPLADKLTLFAVGFCVCCLFPIITPIVCLLFCKEVLMLLGALYLVRRSIAPPQAKWFGKAATILFYFSSMSAIIMFYFGIIVEWLIVAMFTVTFIAMSVAIFGYYRIFKKILNSY